MMVLLITGTSLASHQLGTCYIYHCHFSNVYAFLPSFFTGSLKECLLSDAERCFIFFLINYYNSLSKENCLYQISICFQLVIRFFV